MDDKELRPETKLYLPVFNEGALFMAGDGHGVQGDGEVCTSALETSLTGSFRLTVRKDLGYRHPFAENATHLISIGRDEDLDDAARQAVRQMVEHVVAPRPRPGLHTVLAGGRSARDPYRGRGKGCHMMLAKAAL